MVIVNAANRDRVGAVGTGQTEGAGSATLARLLLTAAERAVTLRALAIGGSGELRELEAVGYMVPEIGWEFRHRTATGNCNIALAVNAATLDFVVQGETGTVEWIGYVDASFTQDYSAS